MNLLNKETYALLPNTIQKPIAYKMADNNHILHFGIGGFHRSHQAYTWQKLIKSNPSENYQWSITGVSLLPSDKSFITKFRAQDNLYTLRMLSSDGSEEIEVINSISSILYGPEDSDAIVKKIADSNLKIISFTITEGGYNMDFEKSQFLYETESIQADIKNPMQPKTVFGFLAKGLRKRMEKNHSDLILMSCDNIQENGEVLRSALCSYLSLADPELKDWVEKHIHFPNSMVDRITPVTTEADRNRFKDNFKLSDEVLVVCEDYFQWVIEGKKLTGLPNLEEVGVELVEDVRPYEAMKLGVLNAGHSLIGFLGYGLGYNTIHEAVVDPLISKIFDCYAFEEAIPTLSPIRSVSFDNYYTKVKSRFSNAMINDSTSRIISGSSDKIPKFILPVVQKQLAQNAPSIQTSALVIAAWWYYLQTQYKKNQLNDLIDHKKEHFLRLFADEVNSANSFINFYPIFGDLGSSVHFSESYFRYIKLLSTSTITTVLMDFINNRANG